MDLTSVVTLEPARERCSSGCGIGDQIIRRLCPDTSQDELVMWELVRHWLRDILSVLHQTVIVASHSLRGMTKSIWNDVNEVLDFVALRS